MAWLKALVIGMGALIVIGVGVVAVTLVNRLGGSMATAPAAAGRIVLPRGAQIAETHVDGKNVVLRLTLPDGASRIVVYDTSGRLVSTLDVVETK